MKVKKVNRYYCEFCKKAGCSGGHIAKHEKHCTMNPNRICRMREKLHFIQPKISLVLEVLPNPADYEIEDKCNGYSDQFDVDIASGMSKLRKITKTCPMCVMAALRQKGIPIPVVKSFNYKEECASIWAAYNDEQHKSDELQVYYG